MISKAAVFCPCRRNGLMELTMVTGASLPICFTSSMPSSKLPLIWITTAPWITACASLPMAILPSGISTNAALTARAAYAAAEAEVLPVAEQRRVAFAETDDARVVVHRQTVTVFVDQSSVTGTEWHAVYSSEFTHWRTTPSV